MKLRKFIITAIAAAAIASTATLQAQDEKKGGKGGGMPTAEQRIERLETAVGSLTAEQKKKILDIYAKLSEKVAAMPQEERRAKMMEVFAASQKEVRAVLTPEQAKKFDDMPQMGRGGSGGGGERKKKDQ